GEDLERQRLQRVSGENRCRLVEGAVGGRASASQVVVVHRRQIVVNQRIGMDAFDRRARTPRTVVRSPKRPRRLHGQEGSQPLTAAKRRIAHGLDEALGTRRLAGPRFEAKQDFELALGPSLTFSEPSCEGAIVHWRGLRPYAP